MYSYVQKLQLDYLYEQFTSLRGFAMNERVMEFEYSLSEADNVLMIFYQNFESDETQENENREIHLVYLKIMRQGLENLKILLEVRNWQECHAEADLMHNIPSIIGENRDRDHRHFVLAEIPSYLHWKCTFSKKYSKLFKTLRQDVGWWSIILHKFKSIYWRLCK